MIKFIQNKPVNGERIMRDDFAKIHFQDVKLIIQSEVEKYYKLPEGSVNNSTRKREVVQPRQMCHYFGNMFHGGTFHAAGLAYGGKDHATAIHSKREISKFLESVRGRHVDEDIYRAYRIIGEEIRKRAQNIIPYYGRRKRRRDQRERTHKAVNNARIRRYHRILHAI